MSYTINNGASYLDFKVAKCEVCGIEFETNINRRRCSLKCATKAKNARHSWNRAYNKILANN